MLVWLVIPLSDSVSYKLLVPEHVIRQAFQKDVCCGSCHPYCPHGQPVHCSFHKPKDMFHPRAYGGFLAVFLLLFLGQWLSSIAFFAYLVFQSVPLQRLFLSDIRAVGKCDLPTVALIHQVGEHLRVVRGCGGHHNLLDELTLAVHLRTDFVPEEILTAFLCPTGIDVLLPLLVRIVIS